jgi:hypothetical protein
MILIKFKTLTMDLTSIIMGVALLALFALPFILISMASKKNKKQLIDKLSKLAEKHNSVIKESDHCNNFAIGIDTTEKALFYIKTGNEGEKSQVIKLIDYKTTRIVNLSKTLGDNGAKTIVTSKLALAFVPVNKDKPEIQLDFYNSEDKNQITSELELLSKWNELIILNLK